MLNRAKEYLEYTGLLKKDHNSPIDNFFASLNINILRGMSRY